MLLSQALNSAKNPIARTSQEPDDDFPSPAKSRGGNSR
jgi:hypothetical protein